jgi:RNAse (barnase) inhibitor barstar
MANLNTIPNSQFTSGAQPVITGAEHSYSIVLLDSANNAISERYYYTVANNCSRYPKKRFQFLNELGGYDFFNFTLVSKENVDIERSNYKKTLGTASTTRYTYSPNDRANTQFHTRMKDKISVQSDWVTEAQMLWLEELMTSPDVLYDDGTYLIPVNITNSSFERKQEVNEKLFNLTIEYTLSYDRYRQRL